MCVCVCGEREKGKEKIDTRKMAGSMTRPAPSASSAEAAAARLRAVLRGKLKEEQQGGMAGTGGGNGGGVSGGLFNALKLVDAFIVEERRRGKARGEGCSDIEGLKQKVRDVIVRGEVSFMQKQKQRREEAIEKAKAEKERKKKLALALALKNEKPAARPRLPKTAIVNADSRTGRTSSTTAGGGGKRIRANDNTFSIFESTISHSKKKGDNRFDSESVVAGAGDSDDALLGKGLVPIVTKGLEPWTLPGNVIERAGRTVPTEYDILARRADSHYKFAEQQRHVDEVKSKELMKSALLQQMEERRSRAQSEMEEKKAEAEKIQRIVAEELREDERKKEKAALLARREMEDRKQQVARTRALHMAEMERTRREDQRRLQTIMQEIRDTEARKREQLVEDRKKMAELQVENMKKRQDKVTRMEEQKAADLKLMVEYDMMLKNQADRRDEEREKVVQRQLEMFHRAGGEAMEKSLSAKQKEDEAKAIAMAAEYERKTAETERIKKERLMQERKDMLAALDAQLAMKQATREKERDDHVLYGKQLALEIEEHNRSVKLEKERKKELKKKHHAEILQCMKEEAIRRLGEATELMTMDERDLNIQRLTTTKAP